MGKYEEYLEEHEGEKLITFTAVEYSARRSWGRVHNAPYANLKTFKHRATVRLTEEDAEAYIRGDEDIREKVRTFFREKGASGVLRVCRHYGGAGGYHRWARKRCLRKGYVNKNGALNSKLIREEVF